MKYRVLLFLIVSAFTMLIAAGTASASVVVYLDEYNSPFGYDHPDATDALSALTLLSTPPGPAVVGRELRSGVLPGTRVLDLKTEGDTTIVNFSIEIIGTELDEARLTAIFEQVNGTLYQFGFQGNIKILADGKPLCEYVPAPKPVEPSPEALREQTLKTPPIMGTVGLGGKKITVSPGHGKRWNGTGWNTARPVYCSPLAQEDYHNLDNSQYLETYLAQDSATVKMVRCTNKTYGAANPWIPGEPWWHMGSCYWLKEIGYPCTVWGWDPVEEKCINIGVGGSDDTQEIQSRPLSSDYDASDIYISLHTNGYTGDCTGSCPTGTCTYYDAGTEHAPWGAVSQSLANNVNGAMIDAIRTKYPDGAWANRGVLNSNGAYGEIRIPDRAAILIELAFHDTCDYDAVYLRDNFFRSTCMWAVYKGTCDYFGVTPTWDYYSNEFVSHDIPAAMNVGDYYTVHVTMKNRGVLWNDTRGFHLGAVGDSDPMTATTRQPISGEVGPNSTYTFTYQLRAPVTPGTYVTDWRMVRDGYTWFGPTVSQTVDVTGTPDTDPPTTPTNLTATPQSHVRINLSWTASTDNIGVAGYYVYRDNVKIATTTGLGTTYSDGTCSPSTTYTYEVSAYDGFANESGRSDPAVATTAAGDDVPPSVPTNLVATGFSMTQIDLTWTASTDNVAVTGYKIYRNGSYLTSVAGTSYSNISLSANTTFTYTVSAYDAASNESGQSNSSTATTWILIYQEGFPDISNWTADTVFDGTVRGGAYSTTYNHADYTGAGDMTMTAGTSGTNGCFSYRALGAAFTSGRLEAYFYDAATPNTSRQGIWIRIMNGTSHVGSCYLGTYSAAPGSTSTYSAGVYTGSAWDWAGACQARSLYWRGFRIDVMPSGTGAIKFYIDGALKATKERFANIDTYGISRNALGHNYNVNQQGWFDDVQFSVPAPKAPTIGTPSLVTVSSIRWNFTNNADSQNAFALHDNSHVQKGTGTKTATYINESSLAGNTQYTRHVHAKNGTAEGPASASVSKYTLSVVPTTSTVTCDKAAGSWNSDPDFTFTAVGGFGAGKIQYYRCVWDQSAAHTWTGTEPVWDADTQVRTAGAEGSWYFHVRGYNAEDVANGSLDRGPYGYDTTPPTAPTVVTDEGQYTPSTTELVASWSGATDDRSGIVQYKYAVGTTEGDNDVLDWTFTTGTSANPSGLSLSAGTTYYISVKAKNGAGLWGDEGYSDGIKPVAETGSIRDAKDLDNGPPERIVSLFGKAVTANFGSVIYVQEPGYVELEVPKPVYSGIKVNKVNSYAASQGSWVDVAGIMAQTTAGERVVDQAVVKAGASGTFPQPIHMMSRVLGGEAFNEYTPGIPGMVGVNNIGLLVTAIGNITKLDTVAGYMYVDDGSACQYDPTYKGIYVDISGLSTGKKGELAEGQMAIATGICTVGTINSCPAPVIKLRGDPDVVHYP